MNTRQKFKGRNNWNRERKRRIKEDTDKPFVITKEYPNIVTLCADTNIDMFANHIVPDKYIEDKICSSLAKELWRYTKFYKSADHYMGCVRVTGVIKVLDERED